MMFSIWKYIGNSKGGPTEKQEETNQNKFDEMNFGHAVKIYQIWVPINWIKLKISGKIWYVSNDAK